MNQLQQPIQPLLAGADTDPPVAAAAPQPMTFALPVIDNSDQLIYFSTPTEQTLYDAGGSKLMDDLSRKFNPKVSQVVMFQETWQMRSEDMG